MSPKSIARVALCLLAFTSAPAFCDVLGNGESEVLTPATELKIQSAVEEHIEGIYGIGAGINLDMKCLKHTEFSAIYCNVAFSTGGGILGIMALRFDADGSKLRELDRVAD